jgi:hypothetical protein
VFELASGTTQAIPWRRLIHKDERDGLLAFQIFLLFGITSFGVALFPEARNCLYFTVPYSSTCWPSDWEERRPLIFSVHVLGFISLNSESPKTLRARALRAKSRIERRVGVKDVSADTTTTASGRKAKNELTQPKQAPATM